MGRWKIGKWWVLRGQPNDASLGNNYMTQEFIRNQPDLAHVSVLKEMRLLSEPDDQIQPTLMIQVHADRLDELADVLIRLRQLHAPSAQKVNGDPLDDPVIACCGLMLPPRCKKIGATNEKWIDNKADELRHGLAKIHRNRDPGVIEDKLQELRDNFPSSEPYVLTHGDLNLSNIMVKNDKIEAVIDWECAGYSPWWVEFMAMKYQPLETDEDEEIEYDLWGKVMTETTIKPLNARVCSGLGPVAGALAACEIDHPGELTAWYRPGFLQVPALDGRVSVE